MASKRRKGYDKIYPWIPCCHCNNRYFGEMADCILCVFDCHTCVKWHFKYKEEYIRGNSGCNCDHFPDKTDYNDTMIA